jgi:hypothetical protein
VAVSNGCSPGSRLSTPRSCRFTNTARPFRGSRGASSNYKKFGDEPPDHAIGRSRGGLTTKNDLVCDGKGRALAFILTPGQSADTSMLSETHLSRSVFPERRVARVLAPTECP